VSVDRGWILQKEELNEKTQQLAADEARVKVAQLETALDATTRAISDLQEQILKLQEALKSQEETRQARGSRCGVSVHGALT
jgi:hypothetical protein